MSARRLLGVSIKFLFLCLTSAASLACSGTALAFGDPFPTMRISIAGDKFDGTTQFAVAFKYPAFKFLSPDRLEFAIGSISDSSATEAFFSLGPVWRTRRSSSPYFAEFGIAPTLITGSTYNGRDIGGNFHFTSFVSVGRRIGSNGAVALRIHHISNGGLNNANPGIDMIGIEFSVGSSD